LTALDIIAALSSN